MPTCVGDLQVSWLFPILSAKKRTKFTRFSFMLQTNILSKLEVQLSRDLDPLTSDPHINRWRHSKSSSAATATTSGLLALFPVPGFMWHSLFPASAVTKQVSTILRNFLPLMKTETKLNLHALPSTYIVKWNPPPHTHTLLSLPKIHSRHRQTWFIDHGNRQLHSHP